MKFYLCVLGDGIIFSICCIDDLDNSFIDRVFFILGVGFLKEFEIVFSIGIF